MPLTCFAWAVGGLGLIGVPVTAGFVSKWMLLTATMDAGNLGVAMLMLISSLLAVVYVWKVVEVIYFSEPSEKVKAAKEAPLIMLVPTLLDGLLGPDCSVGSGCVTECERGGPMMMTPEQLIMASLALPLLACLERFPIFVTVAPSWCRGCFFGSPANWLSWFSMMSVLGW